MNKNIKSEEIVKISKSGWSRHAGIPKKAGVYIGFDISRPDQLPRIGQTTNLYTRAAVYRGQEGIDFNRILFWEVNSADARFAFEKFLLDQYLPVCHNSYGSNMGSQPNIAEIQKELAASPLFKIAKSNLDARIAMKNILSGLNDAIE